MAQLEKRVRAVLAKAGKKPVSARELRKLVGVGRREGEQFKRLMEELLKKGELVRGERGFLLSRQAGARPATIIKIKPRFGFARVDGAEQDVFVPGRQLMGTMPGDRVMVRVSRSDGTLEAGEVLSILSRADRLLSGTVRKNEEGKLELTPDDGRYSAVLLDPSGAPCAEGDKIIARIEPRGDSHRDHRAVATACFGSGELAKNCCDAILAAAGIEREFPREVLEAAERSAGRAITEKELSSRLDLRDCPIFTIDGADTKDIDDAVSLKKTPRGWELGVHIADVSRYVEAGSVIDNEALLRGTSVYFADSVVPMLPKALSNGACSLNPGEERLAFSAIMQIGHDGALLDWKFRKSVIRSRVKGVYAEVNAIYDGTAGEAVRSRYEGLVDTLLDMRELAERLKKQRFGRGALNLSSVESKIVIGPDGQAADILPRRSGEAENVVEEFMLTANEAAASLALSRGLPFVYRVHEPPAPDKLAGLKELLDLVGLPSAGVEPGVRPAVLSGILDAARETPYGMVVNSSLLRAMQKARYDVKCLGHYGLALSKYAHFTSPIRRYPDLAVHRVLTAFAQGGQPGELDKRFAAFAAEASRQSSETELRAMGAERSCEDCYKAEYLRGRLGERFEGVISSCAPHGVYVLLDSTAEGLIRAERLPEGMLYDGRMQYALPDGSRRLRVGDRATVLVAAADVATGRVDFDLAE